MKHKLIALTVLTVAMLALAGCETARNLGFEGNACIHTPVAKFCIGPTNTTSH